MGRGRNKQLLAMLYGLFNGIGFNTPLLPDILVCTQVGQEAIDLHRHCRHVVHCDLGWNPAAIEQRTGRTDRIGSKAERERKFLASMCPKWVPDAYPPCREPHPCFFSMPPGPPRSYEQGPSASTREVRLAEELVSGQSTGCWSAQGLHKGKNSTLSFQSSGVVHSIATISSSWRGGRVLVAGKPRSWLEYPGPPAHAAAGKRRSARGDSGSS